MKDEIGTVAALGGGVAVVVARDLGPANDDRFFDTRLSGRFSSPI